MLILNQQQCLISLHIHIYCCINLMIRTDLKKIVITKKQVPAKIIG